MTLTLEVPQPTEPATPIAPPEPATPAVPGRADRARRPDAGPRDARRRTIRRSPQPDAER